eukprot:TRINITY_DN93694_c0_g1_i1.p1 TRINITY_DN93694_c0_g1~~TRINITY_DN93694_c0_g1_i1.p1  ORF type:complete len:181 (-),score=20.01 TRINITY_DN93694_c0_g1_i1:2-544(-)
MRRCRPTYVSRDMVASIVLSGSKHTRRELLEGGLDAGEAVPRGARRDVARPRRTGLYSTTGSLFVGDAFSDSTIFCEDLDFPMKRSSIPNPTGVRGVVGDRVGVFGVLGVRGVLGDIAPRGRSMQKGLLCPSCLFFGVRCPITLGAAAVPSTRRGSDITEPLSLCFKRRWPAFTQEAKTA